ncbi:sugar phosphate isomerase/epimerase family protein [Petroclostridium sp. X23]|uniref:sugar phosphate isomerase/epimerase family protein n=1 Tax=Petroclostridium sp. X23 TaxID=3045146 RepID=UPI0024ACF158|nr:sugar phosphate isomerase/epimerase family protein [Petroclostridium sp. X23]WHH58800.1 sugar phosphate isomerase/epimerase family protein [Petroclostridium sp. X23]
MSRKVSYGLAISEEVLGEGAPVLLQGGVEKAMIRASELGFDSAELHIREPGQFDVQKLLDISNQKNIRIAAVGTGLEYGLNGLNITSPDKSLREKMSARLKEHIDFAANFNAVVFLGLLRGKAPSYAARKEYLDRLAQEFIPIAAYAAERGVILGLEPIVFYLTNLLNTTEETLEFLERPGLETIQLLLDTHHMFIEDKDMFESFRMCKGKIAHLHISDSNRQYPGGGNVDYTKVGDVLKEIGYDRAVSLEVVPYPSGEQAAVYGIEWMRSIWGA